MKGINAPTVTVLDVGARLIRQRGTATGTPEFIATYLAAEYARDPLCGFTAQQRTWRRAMKAENIQAGFITAGIAFSTGLSIESLRSASEGMAAVANTAVRTFAAHPELKAAVQAMGGPP